MAVQRDSIRFILKPRLKALIRKRSQELGIGISTYMKHLVLADITKNCKYQSLETTQEEPPQKSIPQKPQINEQTKLKAIKLLRILEQQHNK